MSIEPSFSIVLFVGLVLFAASMLQGATGFGFGLLTMGLLPIILPIDWVSMLVAVVMLPVLLGTLVSHWRHASLRDLSFLWLGAAVGVIPGVFLLVLLDPTILLRLLGLILIAAGLHSWTRNGQSKWAQSRTAALLCGLGSGSLGGAFNSGGPPLVYYAYNQPWTLRQSIANLQVLFVSTAVLKLIFGASSGLISSSMLTTSALALIPVALGLICGTQLSQRLPVEPTRKAVFLLLGLIGLYFVISA